MSSGRSLEQRADYWRPSIKRVKAEVGEAAYLDWLRNQMADHAKHGFGAAVEKAPGMPDLGLDVGETLRVLAHIEGMEMQR